MAANCANWFAACVVTVRQPVIINYRHDFHTVSLSHRSDFHPAALGRRKRASMKYTDSLISPSSHSVFEGSVSTLRSVRRRTCALDPRGCAGALATS
jgi:hypothetical protein